MQFGICNIKMFLWCTLYILNQNYPDLKHYKYKENKLMRSENFEIHARFLKEHRHANANKQHNVLHFT